MNKPATIILTILVTLAILILLSGVWQIATDFDHCGRPKSGEVCVLHAMEEISQ